MRGRPSLGKDKSKVEHEAHEVTTSAERLYVWPCGGGRQGLSGGNPGLLGKVSKLRKYSAACITVAGESKLRV